MGDAGRLTFLSQRHIQEHMVITKNFLETISMKKTKFTGFCLRSKFSELDTFVWTVV